MTSSRFRHADSRPGRRKPSIQLSQLPPKQKLDTDVLIQPASVGDAAAIVAVLAANRDDLSLYQKSASTVREEIENFVVARMPEGKIIGCAGLWKDQPHLAEIYAIAVLPEWQAQGLGTRLVETCEQRAHALGVQTLWLSTTKVEFFSRFGYAAISRYRLPTAVLLRKLRLTFRQPVSRWLPAIFGRHTFMWKRLSQNHA